MVQQSKDRITAKNRAYFEFIDQLKKDVKGAPRSEQARFYKEAADILSEAYDEYEPTELPKYQARLQNLIKLGQQEGILDDSELRNQIFKAKELLDNKVKERFGAFKKISHLGEQSVRVLGSVSSYVSDFIAITDRAAEAGRRLGNLNFGSRRRIDAEEERRQYDLIRGNTGQYGDKQADTQPPQPILPGGSSPMLALPAPNSTNVTPVKDDKLIGSTDQQSKVLIQLVTVSKNTNEDIKQIKKLLIYDAQEEDLQRDRAALDAIEARNENQKSDYKDSIKTNGGLLASLFGGNGKSGMGKPGQEEDSDFGGGSFANTALGAWLLYKFPGIITKSLTFALAGKSLYDSYDAISNNKENAEAYGTSREAAGLTDALYSATFGAGDLLIGDRKGTAQSVENVGNKIKDNITTPMIRGGQSTAASIGEKLKGINYYKDLFKAGGLTQGDQDQAEQWAWEYLQKIANDKKEAFDKKYSNGTLYGSGQFSYPFIEGNDAPTIDEALADVQAAKKNADDYAEYLKARKTKGNLGPLARFKDNGKLYTNPLFQGDQSGRLEVQPKVSNDGEFELLRSDTMQTVKPSMRAGDGNIDIPSTGDADLDMIKRAITAAETGPITDANPMGSADRYIRTKGGATSSAWGPQQITKSLAEGASNNGLFSDDPDLQKWVDEKFIPQGRKFLKSDYSDPVYGAGGKGDLTSAEDRKMYDKMASILIGDAYRNNKGNVMGTLGEWHYGASEKHMLMSRDPKYAEKANKQLAADIASQKLEMVSVPQAPIQTAMTQMSKEQDAATAQPIIIPVSNGQSSPVGATPSVSTKSVGASPNGVSEASMMLAIRQSTSPLG